MNRLEQIQARLTEIRGLVNQPNADLEALETEINTLTAERGRLVAASMGCQYGGTPYDNFTPEMAERMNERLHGGQPSDPRMTDPARRIVAQAEKRGLLPAHAAAVAESLVMTGEPESRSLASRWVQATGSEHYLSALLPLILDPTVLLTSEGSNNPLRQISRVVQTTGNAWQGVTSAGVSAEWKGETDEAADAGGAVAPAPIPVFFGDAYTEFSFEIEQDGLEFSQQLATILMDAADQLQAVAFTTGLGTTQPTGFVTALAGTASEVPASVSETFGADDVYVLQNALSARFQARARWCAALPTINAMGQMETTNGARLFPEIAQGQLLRRPLNECSNMASTDDVDTGADADNLILAYGDFSQFVIVDRIGTMIEIIPNVIGENRRPRGMRGAFLWFRTGSDVVVPEAFRILNVSTAVS